jgi:RNA polymerase sigma-70 factor (ECF subfamily)
MEKELGDVELFERFRQAQDADALGTLFLRHRDWMFRLALRITGSSASAEDAVQNTFLACLKQQRHFDANKGAVKQWFAGIVIKQSKQLNLRKQRAHKHEAKTQEKRPRPMEAEATEQLMDRSESAELVREALTKLPEEYRTAVSLHYMEGFSILEAAKSIGIPERTLRHRLEKSLQLLRIRLAGSGIHSESGVLVGLLAAIPLESAPQALAQQIQSLVAKNAAKAFAQQSVGGSVIGWTGKAAIATIALASTGLIGVWYWNDENINTRNVETPAVPAAQQPEALKPGMKRSWSFEHGPAKDLKVVYGHWEWWPEDDKNPAVMATAGEDGAIVVFPHLFPSNFFATPMLLTCEGEAGLADENSMAALHPAWLSGNTALPYDIYPIKKLNFDPTKSVNVRFYAIGANVVMFAQNQASFVHRLTKEAQSVRAALIIRGFNLRKIEFLGINKDDVPKDVWTKLQEIEAAEKENKKIEKYPHSMSFDGKKWLQVQPRHLGGFFPEEVAPPPLQRQKWTFEKGLPSDWKVIRGEYKEVPAHADLPACIATAPTIDKTLNVYLPAKVSIRPFWLNIKARVMVSGKAGIRPTWATKETGLRNDSRHNRRSFDGIPPNYTMSVEYYFNGRYIVGVYDGELLGIQRFEQRFPAYNIGIAIFNYGIESVELRELNYEEIPEKYRRPDVLWRTMNFSEKD